tara:strand:- start:207 stop:701 length:495 start_codon:yes stop_codon:yes gene_type:complete
MNITKRRLEQLIKEEYNIFLDELPSAELQELLFEEDEWKPGDKKFFSTSEEAREYARNVERAREQGIDPDKARTVRAGFGMVDPFAKYREKIKTKKIAQDRVERRKQLAALRKADQAEAPMTPDDAPMSIDRNMLDAPALSEDGPGTIISPLQLIITSKNKESL